MKFETRETGHKNLLKMKDGETVRGVFAGEPHQFEQHWKDRKSSLCIGRLDCDLCASGDKAKFRFQINFITKENDAYVGKVLEQGWKVWLALKDLHEGGYDLEKYLMKISRTGQTMNDTTYSIVPVPNGLLNAEQLASVHKVPLTQFSDSHKTIPSELNVSEHDVGEINIDDKIDEIPF